LKLEYDEVLSNFAFNTNLRRYITAAEAQTHDATTKAATLEEELAVVAVRPGRQCPPRLRPAL